MHDRPDEEETEFRPGLRKRKSAFISPANLLARRLDAISPLKSHEIDAIEQLPFTLRDYTREQVIAHPGETPSDLRIVGAGAAGRVKTTWRGQRQIVAVYLPGDVLDSSGFHVNAGRPEADRVPLDEAIWSLSDCVVASFRAPAVLPLLQEHRMVRRAFEKEALLEFKIGREWLLNIGSRAAPERVAHLLCEIYHRMKAVGLADGASCHLPLTQASLSEALAISIVHTNRVLQRMRADGLVSLSARTLSLLDAQRLAAFADFSPRYLTV